jgi:hypothetical protein
MFVSQVSAGEKSRPKAVAGLIEIAARTRAGAPCG